MREMDACSVDAIVTDPPYGLEFMSKAWDGADGFRRSLNVADVGRDSVFGRSSRTSPEYRAGALFQEFSEAWAREALRVLRPGGHLLAFGGSRTYHRLACAIEDAGFEIRDQIMWVYGSGFPKSLNVGQALDRAVGAKREVVAPPPYTRGKASQSYSDTRKVSYDYQPQPITAPASDAAKQWDGWGTALKPAHEPIVVARKPLKGTVAANVLEHGTGAINIDACRVPGEPWKAHTATGLGRVKFFTEGEASEIEKAPHALGRWPANLIHDGSEEVLSAFAEAPGQLANVSNTALSSRTKNCSGPMSRGDHEASRNSDNEGAVGFKMKPGARRLDSGTAARFFFCAKPSRKERDRGLDPTLFPKGNHHPTVKPIALMRYLIRLVTPLGGIVLDPFCGSGTTGIAAAEEGFDFVGIDLDDYNEWLPIAEARIGAAVPPEQDKE